MKELLREMGKHKILVRLTAAGFILLILLNIIIISHQNKIEAGNQQSIKPATALLKPITKTIQIK